MKNMGRERRRETVLNKQKKNKKREGEWEE